MGIREDMPLLARHEGEWGGTYTYVDRSGKVTDEHRSLLSCRLPDDGTWDYYQVNKYTWADGRTEEHRFPAPTWATGAASSTPSASRASSGRSTTARSTCRGSTRSAMPTCGCSS